MKKFKLISVAAVLALSAVTMCSALPFAGCTVGGGAYTGDKYVNGSPAKKIVGKTYYVASDADNQTGDGTEANPYDVYELLHREQMSDEQILQPGDTVLFKAGRYELDSLIRITASGKFNGMITFKPAGEAGSVTLDFSSQSFASTNRGVELYGNYLYWYGIDVCGAGDNGLYIGGSYNTVEYCEFYNNRDTGLQLGRRFSEDNTIDSWPSFNLVKDCTSHNNYDNETYGENADGFAAKLTVGYANVFDGCIAYRNSDDGWDLYAKTDSGNIGQVIIYNCAAYENGYLEYDQRTNNKIYPTWTGDKTEAINADKQPDMSGDNKYGKLSYKTRDGDGNGFKLGGSVMEGDVLVYNCLSFNNRMHGVTDNSNPGYLYIDGVTSYNNSANVDDNPYLMDEEGNIDTKKPNPNFGRIVNKVYDYNATAQNDSGEVIVNPTFNEIIANKNHDTHGNINVARQTYSYNTVNRTLSVKDTYGISVEADEYRGSVRDSMLLGNGRANKVDGSIDADTIAGTRFTESVTSLVSSEIFKKLPFTEEDYSFTYNISGWHDLGETPDVTTLNPQRHHIKYRNEDHSINMGDILAVKDYSKLLGEQKKIGSVLNLGSWNEYGHFTQKEWNDKISTSTGALLTKVAESVTLNADEQAVYQDFDVITKLLNCTVEWTSSDENYIKAGRTVQPSISGSQYVTINVNRPTDEDKVVTLTAKISYLHNYVTKNFTLTVKKDNPTIGGLNVLVEDGTEIADGGRLILDMYRQYKEPALRVQNGAYYNGTLLKDGQYTVDTKYEYALTDSSNDKDYTTVGNFTPNKAGVFRITHTVKLAGLDESRSMTYKIFVASTTAQLDFIGSADIVVNRDGYTIGGALNSPTGKIYALSTTEDLTLTGEQLKAHEGVQSYEFRDTSINKQFTSVNNNSGKYNIYYALENLSGEITSQVYKTSIKEVAISTPKQFRDIAMGGTLDSSAPEDEEAAAKLAAATIYKLTQDIDFTGFKYERGTKAFAGFLNGAGHTVSNVTVEVANDLNGAGLFYAVKGGTIENIKFDNIKIVGGKQQTGIIATMYGGYVHNVACTNISISGTTRIGFIGHVFESNIPTFISNVSVVNEILTAEQEEAAAANGTPVYKITGTGNRVSGIVGLIQTTSAPVDGVDVRISNCYISTKLKGEQQVGGCVGSFDNAKAGTPYSLEIDHCMFTGEAETTYSTPRVGGIIGYQSGAIGSFYIHHCVSVGKLINKGEITTSQKTASPIVGGSATTAVNRVELCVATMAEYNTNYEVESVMQLVLADKDFFFNDRYGNFLEFNEEYWEPVLAEPENPSSALKAPYITLKFIDPQA